jgi:predicted TIM-barrel fold metal-dependent hydrolase
MTNVAVKSSAQVRSEVGHPIIDADGHMLEFSTCLRDDVLAMAKEMGGKALVKKVESVSLTFDEDRHRAWAPLSEEARRDEWAPCMAWWGSPTGALDRASAHLPALLHERLDELGIDYCVLFPSGGAVFSLIRDDDVRRVACRTLNDVNAELYRAYSDRLMPVALIPTATPDEAVAEIEHAVLDLGLKVVLLGRTYRTVPKVAREYPGAASFAQRVESFGIDSPYDYDAVWRRCAELRVPIAIHHTEQGYGSRRSPSRYVYNHIGAFAAGCESICKSLFLGGVTRRFPALRFAFLEGGIGWGVSLFSDLVSHWEKRNSESILGLDPELLDLDEFERLTRRYGGKHLTDRLDRAMQAVRNPGWRPAQLDDWSECAIDSVEDFRDLFLDPFFFGCEADDRLNALAFDTRLNPLGGRLQAIFGSDIGHWDVRDMSRAVAEAYELVEQQLLTPDDFRDLMFTNPVRYLAGANPDFFRGTNCEEPVRLLMSSSPGRSADHGSEVDVD